MAKKFFKKALSMGLSLALCAGLALPAFAADEAGETPEPPAQEEPQAEETTKIYIYAKVDQIGTEGTLGENVPDPNFNATSPNGKWLTVGCVEVPSDQLPNNSDSDKEKLDTANSWNIDPKDIEWFNDYDLSKLVGFQELTWTALKQDDGATDYVPGGTKEWHLDGKIDLTAGALEGVKNVYTYVYVGENPTTDTLPEAGDKDAKQSNYVFVGNGQVTLTEGEDLDNLTPEEIEEKLTVKPNYGDITISHTDKDGNTEDASFQYSESAEGGVGTYHIVWDELKDETLGANSNSDTPLVKVDHTTCHANGRAVLHTTYTVEIKDQNGNTVGTQTFNVDYQPDAEEELTFSELNAKMNGALNDYLSANGGSLKIEGLDPTQVTNFTFNVTRRQPPVVIYPPVETVIDEPEVPLAGLFTRADAIGYLWEQAGEPEAELSDFPDVPEDHDWAAAIGWAQDMGIALADKDGNFRPDDLVLRSVESLDVSPEGELQEFLNRYAVYAGVELSADELFIELEGAWDDVIMGEDAQVIFDDFFAKLEAALNAAA